jgi:ketosteroid isomerase-like protein
LGSPLKLGPGLLWHSFGYTADAKPAFCGVERVDRTAYERYLAAFNARDYDGVCDFYAEPMDLEFFGIALRSRQDLKRFYGFLHSYVKESVTVRNFASSPTLTAVDAVVRLEAFRDLDRDTLSANGYGQLFPIKAGEVQELRQFIFYTLADGKITRTECTLAPS